MNRQIIDEDGNKRFDTRVHIKDPKTGALLETRPYTLKCHGDIQYYVDKKTGDLYWANGEKIQKESLKDLLPSQEEEKNARKLKQKDN